MFTKIQKYLLLNHPIIWNTKFFPMLVFGFIFNILFFGLGYLNGTINFQEYYNSDSIALPMIFGILTIILTFIVWLVFYFKNNSLKSFYKKSNYALFYEWLQVFTIIVVFVSFFLTFNFGKQLHQKSYFSETELKERCKTIAQANIFIDGSFAQTEIDTLKSNFDTINPENQKIVYKDYIVYRGKKYDAYSLLNRNIVEFSIFNHNFKNHEIEVKNWLVSDNKQAVKNLMTQYLNLIKEHKLKTNLSLNQWFTAVYNYPDFTNFLYIKDKYYNENQYYPEDYYEEGRVQTANKYSNLYVQQSLLRSNYDNISEAHTEPFIELESILLVLYISLVVSLLILSFRVTSGKSWLISLVVFGVLQIIFALSSVLISDGYTYFIESLVVIAIVKIYFFSIYKRKKSKQFSAIALNLFLNSFFWSVPIIYILITNYYRKICDFDTSSINCPEYTWLKDNFELMMLYNFIFCVLSLVILFKIIRNWKGISEE